MEDGHAKERVDDAGATLILERAAELDVGQGRWIDLADLRQAALEAGISPSAFEKALEEVGSWDGEVSAFADGVPEPAGEAARPLRDRWARLRPGLMLGVGLALGLLTGFLEGALRIDDEGSVVFSLILALQVFLYLVVRHGRRGALLAFQVDLAALWAGLTFMFMALFPRDAAEISAIMAFVWAVAAAVGAGLVKLVPRSDD